MSRGKVSVIAQIQLMRKRYHDELPEITTWDTRPVPSSPAARLERQVVTQMLIKLDSVLACPPPPNAPYKCYFCHKALETLQRKRCAINICHLEVPMGRENRHAFMLVAAPCCDEPCLLATSVLLEDYRAGMIKDCYKIEMKNFLSVATVSVSLDFCFTCRKLGHHSKCGRCKSARYCSRECQIADHATHSLVCPSAKEFLEKASVKRRNDARS